MTQSTNIFITGATGEAISSFNRSVQTPETTSGYIGGSILARLLTHPERSSLKITALTRSADKAKLLEDKFGVTPLIGSHSDTGKLEKAASEADVVIAAVCFWQYAKIGAVIHS
jgi:predicted dinucleotide-binding enzyme